LKRRNRESEKGASKTRQTSYISARSVSKKVRLMSLMVWVARPLGGKSVNRRRPPETLLTPGLTEPMGYIFFRGMKREKKLRERQGPSRRQSFNYARLLYLATAKRVEAVVNDLAKTESVTS